MFFGFKPFLFIIILSDYLYLLKYHFTSLHILSLMCLLHILSIRASNITGHNTFCLALIGINSVYALLESFMYGMVGVTYALMDKLLVH